MSPDLRDVVFIDIETVACTDQYNSISERFKVQWSRKASFFRNRDVSSTDEVLFHERAGIFAEFGKIIVIGMGRFAENERGEIILKTKALSGHDEKQLLEGFKTIVEKMENNVRLCAHNGKEFDFPYLSRRMLINGVQLPLILNLAGRKSWEIPHLDTMELWKFGDYKHYTSLDLLSAIFDIPTSKTDMDGSQVNEIYYKTGDIGKIADYCIGDIVAVAQVYLKLKGLEVIPPDRIQNI